MNLKCTIVFEQIWDAIHATNEDGSRKYRYIILKGSSRSSKTTSTIDVYDLYARQELNKRLTVWRDTKTDCRATVLKDAIKHFKATGRYKLHQEFNKTESFFTYTQTDSTLEIHGTDDDEKVHGLGQSAAWFNEPYKISRGTFDQVDQRTEDFLIIDYNPKKGHWIEDVAKDPRAIVIHSTFKDNPFCPPEQRIKILSYQPVKLCALVIEELLTENDALNYDVINNPLEFSPKKVKELERCRENEDKRTANEFNWQVYGLGLKAEKPNRIFRWSEISIEEYKALDLLTLTGCDWGTVDPWGIIEAKYGDGRLFLHEKNYLSENQWREHMTATDRAQVSAEGSDEAGKEGGIVTWLFAKLGIEMKSEIVCDTNRPLKIAALRRRGYAAYPATKAAGSILDGIDLLNNLDVYYTNTSLNLKHEQENYSRIVDKYGVVQDEPLDTDNHLIDPARYIALYLQAKGIIKSL